MKFKNRKIITQAILLIIPLVFIVLCHYFLWVKHVNPVPDSRAQYQYIYPVLNYFKLAQRLGNDFLFIWNIVSDKVSPGVGFICWLATSIGLGDIFMAEPYLLNILCILPFLVCGCFYNGSFRKRCLIGLSIYFFPVTQICVKQFSLSGLVVAYSILGVLFFRSWLVSKKRRYFCGFVLSFLVASSFNHLGSLFLFCLIITVLLWSFIKRNLICVSLLSPLAVIIMASYFDFTRLNFSHIYVFSDFHYLGKEWFYSFILLAAILCFLFVFPVLLGFYLSRSKRSFMVRPKFFGNGFIFFLICLLIFHVVICRLFSFNSFLFYGGVIFFALFTKYSFSGTRGFMYLYILVMLFVSFAFYAAYFTDALYALYFSLIMLLVQFISENDRPIFRWCIFAFFFLISNFFPSYKILKYISGDRAAIINSLFFGGPNRNLLTWKKCPVGSLKKDFFAAVSSYDIADGSFFVVENLELEFRDELLRYPVFSLDFSPHSLKFLWDKDEKKLLKMYSERGAEFFEELFSLGQLPFILYVNSDTAGFEDGQSFLRKEGFGINFNQELLIYLQTSGRLDSDYDCFFLPQKEEWFRFCADKRLKLNRENKRNKYGQAEINAIVENRFNILWDEASDFYNSGNFSKAYEKLLQARKLKKSSEEVKRSEMKVYTEEGFFGSVTDDLDFWRFTLAGDDGNISLWGGDSDEILVNRLFRRAAEHFDAGDWENCKSALLMVLEINPRHKEALKDLKIVEEHLNYSSGSSGK